MYEFICDLFLYNSDIFIFPFIIEIKFMIVLGDAELAADAFVAKLAETDDLLE